MSVFSKIKDLGKKISRLESKVNGAISDVKRAQDRIQDGANKYKWLYDNFDRKVRNVTDGVLSELPSQIEEQAEKTARRVFDEMRDEIGDMVEDEVAAFAAYLSKQGIEEFRSLVNETKKGLDSLRESRPALVEEIDNLSVYLELGPCTLTWEGFYTRAEQLSGILDYYVENPPTFRRKDVLDFIAAVGPTSIDSGISVQAAFLVASSKELSVGAGLGEIRLALFLELGDLILDELGVPE